MATGAMRCSELSTTIQLGRRVTRLRLRPDSGRKKQGTQGKQPLHATQFHARNSLYVLRRTKPPGWCLHALLRGDGGLNFGKMQRPHG